MSGAVILFAIAIILFSTAWLDVLDKPKDYKPKPKTRFIL